MEKTLKSAIEHRSIIIWGARIVGIGLSRKCIKENIPVLSFIDSDDSLSGRKINGIIVQKPSMLRKTLEDNSLKKITIIVAVSIKEEEIREMLKKENLENFNIEILYYKNFNNVYYTIDIVSSCNLACLSCAHSLDGEKPSGMMSIDNVKKIIHKIKIESPNCSHVSLYSWGEPLIHPQINEIIKLFHQEGIAVGLSTNLSHYDFKKIEKTMEAEPDYIKISLSGYYPEAYNNTHQGGDINIVKSNLYKLSHLIKKRQLSSLIDINYHLYRDNSSTNLNKMRELANELDFVMSTVHALVMPLERVIAQKQGNPDQQTKTLEDNLLVSIEEGIKASESIDLKGLCPFKENQMNINSDLTVPVCCLVFNRDHIVASSYLDYDLKDINHNKKKANICNTCMKLNLPQYNMGFNKEKWLEVAGTKVITDKGLRS